MCRLRKYCEHKYDDKKQALKDLENEFSIVEERESILLKEKKDLLGEIQNLEEKIER